MVNWCGVSHTEVYIKFEHLVATKHYSLLHRPLMNKASTDGLLKSGKNEPFLRRALREAVVRAPLITASCLPKVKILNPPSHTADCCTLVGARMRAFSCALVIALNGARQDNRLVFSQTVSGPVWARMAILGTTALQTPHCLIPLFTKKEDHTDGKSTWSYYSSLPSDFAQ